MRFPAAGIFGGPPASSARILIFEGGGFYLRGGGLIRNFGVSNEIPWILSGFPSGAGTITSSPTRKVSCESGSAYVADHRNEEISLRSNQYGYPQHGSDHGEPRTLVHPWGGPLWGSSSNQVLTAANYL